MTSNLHQFIRPPQSSINSGSEEEILEGDLTTIEDFFAYFHEGIKMRMEEATTRLVKSICSHDTSDNFHALD